MCDSCILYTNWWFLFRVNSRCWSVHFVQCVRGRVSHFLTWHGRKSKHRPVLKTLSTLPSVYLHALIFYMLLHVVANPHSKPKHIRNITLSGVCSLQLEHLFGGPFGCLPMVGRFVGLGIDHMAWSANFPLWLGSGNLTPTSLTRTT